MLHERLLLPAGEVHGQRVGRIDVVVPVRADEQQSGDRLLAEDEVEEAQRRPARPLQVVDET
jgi:hypothetical protein